MMTYTTSQITELFPDLGQIRDSNLREKVAAVWSEALTVGCGGKGWSFAEIRAIPFTLLAWGELEVAALGMGLLGQPRLGQLGSVRHAT